MIGDMNMSLGKTSEAERSYQSVLSNCDSVGRQSAPNNLELMPCVFAIWRLGTLHGPSGRSELQLAFNILMGFHNAGRLNNAQIDIMRTIERQLAPVNGFTTPPGLNWPASSGAH